MRCATVQTIKRQATKSESMRSLKSLGIVALALFAVGCNSHYEITGRTPSPNGEIVALSYVESGGGAAGWCRQLVALIPRGNSVRPEELNEPEYGEELGFVFSMSCGVEFALSWTSESELRISYSIPADGGVSTYQLAEGFQGRVRVIYEPTSLP